MRLGMGDILGVLKKQSHNSEARLYFNLRQELHPTLANRFQAFHSLALLQPCFLVYIG